VARGLQGIQLHWPVNTISKGNQSKSTASIASPSVALPVQTFF
jgi:hypothetical protein